MQINKSDCNLAVPVPEQGPGFWLFLESNMRYRSSQRRHSIKPASLIFGVAFNPTTSKWSSFCDNTQKVLSENRSEAKAHAACRHYEAALWRRMNARPLADLAHRAI
jgi:hypothetical protein